ncbi:MAG TPA: QVPTGV class sortase B protein-sorting domain-containing protein, partial [Candidatus Choladocola avistercoris]|nr:QVPTGV class sortase B protein-sorting domain-containing protein [Candidatus Choladocola avistercoris]
GTADAKSALTFTNNYGDGDTPDDDGKIHDVIITKKIEGTFADMSDTFSFNVKVNGADGEYYKVEYTNGETTNTTFVSSGNTGITIPDIGHEDTIHIYGLSESDIYMVTEIDGASQGYTVTDSVTTDDAGTVSGQVTVDGKKETITNTKDAATPTGIAMTIAPYAIMVVAAAGVAFLFLRRRNSEF